MGRALFLDDTAMLGIGSRDAGPGLWFAPQFPEGAPAIPARIERVLREPPGLPPAMRARCTALGLDRGHVLTVEHVLSACVGLGVWRATFETVAPEVPIGDGSAQMFVEPLVRLDEGSTSSPPPERVIREAIRVVDPRDADSWIEARPRSEAGCSYAYELDYGSALERVLPAQRASIVLDGRRTREAYIREVAPARTFCLAQEAEAMRSMGLFKGFTSKDLLVIGPEGPIDNAWRFENEPARHKLLDLIGDLALVGGPIRGEIVAHRAGHALNHAMARAIVEHAA